MLALASVINFLIAMQLTYVKCNVWTVDCNVLTTQRMDPIVFPDIAPAGHVHSIVGSSKFKWVHVVHYLHTYLPFYLSTYISSLINIQNDYYSVTTFHDELMKSKCTSCNVKDDLSNYWVPQLYVLKQNDGKFHYVDMDFHVYYKLINDKGQTGGPNGIIPGEFSAFPKEFRMLAGKKYFVKVIHRSISRNFSKYGRSN